MNIRWLQHFFCLIIILLFSFDLYSAEPRRVVRVGYGALRGYHEQTAEGLRFGYGYDYLQELALRAHWDYEYIGYEKSWAELLAMLERGEIDLLSCVNKTPERERKFAFSERPVGLSFTNLTVRAREKRYDQQNYSTWEGMRVGMVAGNWLNDMFDQWAKKKNIKYTKTFFPNDMACHEALMNGDVDSMLSINFRRMENEWILERLFPEPVYFMMRKDDVALLDELNKALSQQEYNKPTLQSELIQKHYRRTFISFLQERERRFVAEAKRNGKTFRALLDPDRHPLVYLEDNKFTGFQYHILLKIIEHSNLNVEIIPCRNHNEYTKIRKSGEFDILLDVGDSFSRAEAEGLYLSDSYLSTPISLLSLKGRTTSTGKTALLMDSNLADILKDNGVDMTEMVYLSSMEAIISAVKNGEVDKAYLNTRTCNEIQRADASGRLTSTLCPDLYASYTMAVKRSAPPELLNILNHAVSAIPESEINDTIIGEVFSAIPDFQIKDWIETHPLKSVLILLVLLTVVVAGFIYILFTRRVRYRNAMVLEKLPLRFFVINRKGGILLANAPGIAAVQMWNTIADVDVPGIRQLMEQNVKKAFQEGSCKVDYEDKGIKRSAEVTRLAESVFGEDAVIWVSHDTQELQDAKAKALDLATRMRLKLKSIGDAVMGTDAEGRITLMNPAAEKFCGISEAAALGMKHEECFHIVSYETGEIVPSPIRHVLATGETVELANHTDLISLDGTRRHIADSAAAVPGPNGEVSGAILVFRDVTDEYNKRDELYEMNESFKISTAMAHVVAFHLNALTMDISGITPLDQYIPLVDGKLAPFEEWCMAEDIAGLKQYFKDTRQAKHGNESIKFRTIHSGKIRTFRCYLRQSAKSDQRLIGVMQEITDYVEQEKLQRETEQMWELVANALPIHFFAKNVDDDFRYVMANRKFADFVGKTSVELVGKNDHELFQRELDIDFFERCDREIVESGESRQFPEAVLDANGRELQLQTLKTTCTGPGGVRMLIGISMDVTEAVNKDRELQKTRDMWNLIGDTLPVFLFAVNVDDQFRYVMVNQKFADFVGIPQDELIGKTCREAFPREETWREFERTDQEIVHSGTARTVSETTVDAHGNPVYLQTILSPVPGPNGEHLLVGVSMDVTAEKERENHLRISNEKLQKYAEWDQFQKQCLAELMVEPDFNSSCEKIVDMLGKSMKSAYVILLRYHQNDRPVLISEKGWQRNRQSIEFNIYEDEYPETFARLKQGIGFWLKRATFENTHPGELEDWQKEFIGYFQQVPCAELLCVPIIHQGKFWGVILTGHSQTEQSFGKDGCNILNTAADMMRLLLAKEDVNMELVRSEREKLLLLDILPLPVVVLSKDGRIEHYNQKFATITQRPEDDLRGKNCNELIRGAKSCETAQCPLHLTLLHNEPQQIECMRDDRNYLVKTMPIFDSTGISRVILIYIDTTEMTRRQELLKQAMENANEAAKAKSYFLATMSHEIRTPLNAVIGFSELLQDDKLSEMQRKEFTEDISTAGNALLLLINDVLDLSKLESGQMTFSHKEMDFATLTDMMKTVFRAKMQEKKLALIMELKPMPLLLLDEQRLRQILFNLLGNAVKFTDAGSITLSGAFRPQNDHTGTLTFSVEDTGCGIPEEDQGSIFDPFVQASAHHGARSAGGTGLGLSIICRLLERMNGSISLESSPGRGSKFTVVINEVTFRPVGDSALEHHTTSDAPIQDQFALRMLVVDDVPLNLKVMTAMCKKLGLAHVETADDGASALAKIQVGSFDIVLTDMWMPGMNGYELAVAIRKMDRDHRMKIVALTADVDSSASFDMSVFDAVLTKPVSAAHLSSCLQKMENQ